MLKRRAKVLLLGLAAVVTWAVVIWKAPKEQWRQTVPLDYVGPDGR